MLKLLFHSSNDISSLIARLAIAITIFPHGAQKALGAFDGNGFTNTMNWLTGTVGLPYPIALIVILSEFVAPILLVFGILSRISVIGIVSVMIGAIVKVHWANGFMGSEKGSGYDLHFLVLMFCLIILVRGGGALSVDRLIYTNAKKNVTE